MNRTKWGMAGTLCLVAMNAEADYFQDQGIQEARVRTDYAAADYGTSTRPLVSAYPDCLWPSGTPNLIHPGCAEGPSVYPASNQFRFNDPEDRFWLLLMNNEPWDIPGNPGPPNQSLPRSLPGLGVMGFAATPRLISPYNRFHLAISHAYENPQGRDGIPFLSIGAAANRGNGGEIGAFNAPGRPHVVQFSTRVNLLHGSTDDYWVASYLLWATVEWGGMPRMLFLHLFHDGQIPEGDWEFSTPTTPGLNRKWNWLFPDSSLYPGAEVAYMDKEDLVHHCGFSLPALPYQTAVNFTIDLQAIYRCASDNGLFDVPMPDDAEIPITGVHWATEIYGEGVSLYATVSGNRMLPASDGDPQSMPWQQQLDDAAEHDSDPEIAETLRHLAVACSRHPTCDAEAGLPQQVLQRQAARAVPSPDRSRMGVAREQPWLERSRQR